MHKKLRKRLLSSPDTEMTKILEIFDFAPEDAGNVLQFLEFCKIKILQNSRNCKTFPTSSDAKTI
jgi:hypothetical protein